MEWVVALVLAALGIALIWMATHGTLSQGLAAISGSGASAAASPAPASPAPASAKKAKAIAG